VREKTLRHVLKKGVSDVGGGEKEGRFKKGKKLTSEWGGLHGSESLRCEKRGRRECAENLTRKFPREPYVSPPRGEKQLLPAKITRIAKDVRAHSTQKTRSADQKDLGTPPEGFALTPYWKKRKLYNSSKTKEWARARKARPF